MEESIDLGAKGSVATRDAREMTLDRHYNA
jgi:hypothetical protein